MDTQSRRSHRRSAGTATVIAREPDRGLVVVVKISLQGVRVVQERRQHRRDEREKLIEQQRDRDALRESTAPQPIIEAHSGCRSKKPKVVVVMPAYNAQHTIEKTWREVVAHDVVDLVIVVDDASQDETLTLARRLDRVMAHVHPKQPRLRRQPEDLLPARPRPRRRHRGDGPPRLSIHAEADPGDGRHGRERLVLLRARRRASWAAARSPAACRCGATSPIGS